MPVAERERLVRRLLYGGRKAKSARKRLAPLAYRRRWLRFRAWIEVGFQRIPIVDIARWSVTVPLTPEEVESTFGKLELRMVPAAAAPPPIEVFDVYEEA